LDKMPDNDTQFKLIGVTNLSDVLIDVNNHLDGNISVRVYDRECLGKVTKITTKDELSELFLGADCMARMNTWYTLRLIHFSAALTEPVSSIND